MEQHAMGHLDQYVEDLIEKILEMSFAGTCAYNVSICFSMRFLYIVLSGNITFAPITEGEEIEDLPFSFFVLYHVNCILFTKTCTRYLKDFINWMSLN